MRIAPPVTYRGAALPTCSMVRALFLDLGIVLAGYAEQVDPKRPRHKA